MRDFRGGWGSCLAANHNSTLGAHREGPDCRHWEPRVSKEQLAALLTLLREAEDALQYLPQPLRNAGHHLAAGDVQQLRARIRAALP